jgi:enoyl-CoA hydratase/carnithine racemase
VSAPGFETLRLAVSGPVGRLTLARPERLNALNRQCLRELAEAAAWFDGQRDVHVVVVAGEGRAFCAGFDLADFAGGDDGLPPRAGADLGRTMADAVGGMRAVTIAAVQGHCVGGGVVLVGCCDLRVAADDAVFSIPEVDLGIPLGWGGVPRLVRELGPAIAKELVMTCRPFDAAEARALRFVNRVVSRDRLEGEVDELADSLAAKAPVVLEVTKRHMNAVAEEAGSTAHAFADADLIGGALRDPSARAAANRYLEAFRKR